MFVASMPISTADTKSMPIESNICHSGTTESAMRVNMAMGEVSGINEHAMMAGFSIDPLLMENIETRTALSVVATRS